MSLEDRMIYGQYHIIIHAYKDVSGSEISAIIILMPLSWDTLNIFVDYSTELQNTKGFDLKYFLTHIKAAVLNISKTQK